MSLQKGVLAVRNAIGELLPNLWSDDEIVDHLNISAKDLCSTAQYITSFATFSTASIVMPDGTTQFAQEYILPVDVDTITGASFLSGTLFPLTPVQREAVQLGGYVGSIPFYFYTKRVTDSLTPQTTNGIQRINLPPERGNDRVAIGLYPIPQSVLPVYIWYIAWHPDLVNPYDICQVPLKFKQPWIAYAVARCKEKISAISEAQYWDAIFEKGKQAFLEYQIQNGQDITPPTYSNRPVPPYFLRGANTVLVIAQNPGMSNM